MENPFEIFNERLNGIEFAIQQLTTKLGFEKKTVVDDELLTVEQAASLLRLSVATLYTKSSKGEIPVMKRSKRIYFSKLELTEYLKQGRKLTSGEKMEEANTFLASQKPKHL